MPILSEEPSLYPSTLLDDPFHEPLGRSWWVLCTKPRQEKAVARDLLAAEVPYFLPLIKRKTAFRGRMIASRVPIFTGYVFLYGSSEERTWALRTNRVPKTLHVASQDRLANDLRHLHHLISSDFSLSIESRLTRGSRVRVKRGPLSGLEGTVLKRHGETRLLVAVDFLQRGASIEIDDFMLESIR